MILFVFVLPMLFSSLAQGHVIWMLVVRVCDVDYTDEKRLKAIVAKMNRNRM